jgi:uncharacterized membrane protein YdbT with pleckstrin-like domain
MSYVDRHLGAGEEVVFRTRLHPVILSGTVVFAAFVLLATTLIIRHNDLPPETDRRIALVGALIAAASLVPPLLRWRTSQFAVTNRRLLVKVGLLSVHTLEVLTSKVESIGVDQTMAGRLLDYGTLRVTGMGGSAEAFPLVAAPLALRDAVVRQSHDAPR